MKKIYLGLFSIVFAAFTFGQGNSFIIQSTSDYLPVNQRKPNGNASLNSSRTTSCSADTVVYPEAKATAIGGYFMGSASSVYGWGQYYDAPQTITVNGFVLHAYVDSSTSQTAPVTCNIYLANADSLPSGSPLASVTVNVDSSQGTVVADFAYNAIFTTPVTVSAPYVITVEHSGGLPVVVLRNSSVNGDGAGEDLAAINYLGTWYEGSAAGVNADMLLYPIVQYDLTAAFSASSNCVGFGDTIVFTNNSSPIIDNRMYNSLEFFNVGNLSFTWDFGDGTTANVRDTSHKYLSTGTVFEVVLTDTIFGWDMTCTDSTSVQLSSLELVTSVTDENCAAGDGSIDLTVNGGLSPFSYSWSNAETTQDITSIGPGTYSVTVTDGNGCDATEIDTVGSIGGPAVTVVSTNDVTCFGGNDGAINISVTGGNSPYSYLWSNSSTTQDLTGISAGTYSVVVSDTSNCQGSESVMIQQPDSINISGIVNDTSGIGSIDLIVLGGSGNYTFDWSTGATTQNLDSITTQGTYTVTVTDGNGCTNTESFDVAGNVSVILLTANNPSFRVYPNPSVGNVYFSSGVSGLFQIQVINILGQTVHAEKIALNTSEVKFLNLHELNEGLYFINITGPETRESFKLTIRH